MCDIFCKNLLLSAAASALPGSSYCGRVPGDKDTREVRGGYTAFFSHGQYRSGGYAAFLATDNTDQGFFKAMDNIKR